MLDSRPVGPLSPASRAPARSASPAGGFPAAMGLSRPPESAGQSSAYFARGPLGVAQRAHSHRITRTARIVDQPGLSHQHLMAHQVLFLSSVRGGDWERRRRSRLVLKQAGWALTFLFEPCAKLSAISQCVGLLFECSLSSLPLCLLHKLHKRVTHGKPTCS